MTHVRAIEIPDGFVRESGPGADRLRAGFVTEKSERQIETQPLTAVSIVGDAWHIPVTGGDGTVAIR